jgi:hypothetical protein
MPAQSLDLSDRREAIALFKNEGNVDIYSYVYGFVIGMPIFMVIMLIPFVYHYCVDEKNPRLAKLLTRRKTSKYEF